MTDVDSIVEAIKSVLPKRRPIEHHEPYYDVDKASALLHRSLLIGPNINYYTKDFETALSVRTGADYVLAVSSGTAALHIALMAAGIKPGDEVLVPSSTFVATANAVVHAGAVPHFFDCGVTIDSDELRIYLRCLPKSQIKAVIPVHLFGVPVNMDGISQVAKEFGLKVIEDAAQAFGSRIGDRHVGTFGNAGILSFNHNKIVTTGGGGVLLTNDAGLIERAYHLSTTYRKKHPWLIEHYEVGWNYRISEFQAAFGLSQLEFFDEILEKKSILANKYRRALNDKVYIMSGGTHRVSNNWLNVIFDDNRVELLDELHREGIRARASFTPLHTLPMFKNNPRSSVDMPQSMRIFKRAVCLPSGAGLV